MKNQELIHALLTEAMRGSGRPRKRAGSKTRKAPVKRKAGSKTRKTTVKRKVVRRAAGSKTVKRKTMKGGKAKSPYIAFVKKYHKQHPNLTWAQAMRKASPEYRKMKGGDLRSVAKKAMQYGSKTNNFLKNNKLISKALRAYSAAPLPGSTAANDLSLLAESLGYGYDY